MSSEIDILKRKLQREMQAREEAEMLLEEKSEQLYETLLEVKDNEEILKSALSSMSEGLLLTNMNHEIILCNEQLKYIYEEWTPLFHKGITLDDSFEPYIQHPAFLQMFEKNLRQCSFEVSLSNGKIISVHVCINEESIIASTHQDVTDVKAVTQEQQKLLLELLSAQKMEAIGKMSGTIAHDFNNIIAAIKGYASFLDEDIPNDEGLRNSVDKIKIATDRAEGLVKQILEYSSQEKPQYHSVSVHKLLQESCNLILPTLNDNIIIKYDNKHEDLLVQGNESQLSQIIMNVLSNARNAFAAAKGTINISYQLYTSFDLNQPNYKVFQFLPRDCYSVIAGLHVFTDPCVKISIRDNGLGMSKNIIGHIFDLFFSTKNAQKGSGFGMYSVANIITEHLGGIKLYSKPNFGTTCEIVIPINNKPDKETQNKTVMIIDDDEQIGFMLNQAINRKKIKSKYINSSTEALKQILNNPNKWSAIISDQMMPEQKGTDILRTLRDLNILTPFILYSGHIDDEAYNPYLKLADCIIKKPSENSEIINILTGLISS